MTISLTRALLDLGTPRDIANLDDDAIGTAIANRFIEWLDEPGYAPGNTCTRAAHRLAESGPAAWRHSGVVGSKGCGAVIGQPRWIAVRVPAGSRTGRGIGAGRSCPTPVCRTSRPRSRTIIPPPGHRRSPARIAWPWPAMACNRMLSSSESARFAGMALPTSVSPSIIFTARLQG